MTVQQLQKALQAYGEKMVDETVWAEDNNAIAILAYKTGINQALALMLPLVEALRMAIELDSGDGLIDYEEYGILEHDDILKKYKKALESADKIMKGE